MSGLKWFAAVSLSCQLFACASSDDSPSTTPEEVAPQGKQLVVADWLNGSLSYANVASLLVGSNGTRESVLSATVDLTKYPPGPLDLAFTPDKKLGLVSSSGGFFSIPGAGLFLGIGSVPAGPGALLMLDPATRTVTGQLEVGAGPMAIGITPDGKRAIVACFGSGSLNTPDGSLAVIDLEQKTVIDKIDAGLFPEELALDDSGTVGIYGFGSAGSLRTFSVADPRNGMSPEIVLEGDSAGVAFFPGTKVAFAVQAPSVLAVVGGGAPGGGYTVVDVQSPTAPVVLQDIRLPEGPIGYPVVAAHNRDSVLVPVTAGGRLVLREYKLVDKAAVLVDTIDIADASLLSALGMAYDEDHTVVLTWASAKALVVVDLAAKTSRVIPWLPGASGPADAAFL